MAGSEKEKNRKRKPLRISLVQGILGAFWDDFGTFYTVKREEKSKIYRRFDDFIVEDAKKALCFWRIGKQTGRNQG